MFFHKTTDVEPMFNFDISFKPPQTIEVTIKATEAFNNQNGSFFKAHPDYHFGGKNQRTFNFFCPDTTVDKVKLFFSFMRDAGVVISPMYKTSCETEGFGLIGDAEGFYQPGTTIQEIHDFAKSVKEGDAVQSHKQFPKFTGELYHRELTFQQKSDEIMRTYQPPATSSELNP